MSKKKRIVVAIVAAIVIIAAIAGGIFGYLWHQQNSLEAEVQSVQDLTWYYYGEEMTSYGRVTNDFYQDVYLLDSQTISEVFVEEGQEVKAGDPLLAYDTTLTSLQMEIQELEVENKKNRLILANRELDKLKKTTPIPDPVETPVEPVMPEPVEQELPLTDAVTGAYNYISGEVVTEQAKSSGEGTPESPYVIRCMPGCYVEGAYLNALGASEEQIFVLLQIINPVSNTADPDKYWMLTSHQFDGMTFAEDAKWSVETKQPIQDFGGEYYPEEVYPEEDIPVIPEGYTAKELAEAIKNAESQVKNCDLDVRRAELQLEQMRKVSGDGIVTAAIDGVVKTVGDRENPPQDGSAFITVSGSEGLYVTGSLSELQLEEVTVGQTVFANSWESGRSFEATIQEISPYPSDGSNSWGEGNPNVSYYPYIAYIADTEGLKNGEYVDLTMTAMYQSDAPDAIYLERAYVREENGKSYVYIADENDRLKKQYVETGKVIYGSAIEIKSGLTMEDRIAFPYGKTAKEGIRVKEASGNVFYY